MLVFDAFLIYKQISHSIRRTFVGKKNLKAQNYSPRYETFPRMLPKTIWVYWDSPIEEAPEGVRLGIESWRRKNPNWELHVLTERNLSEYIDVPPTIPRRKIQWRADVIRVALLARYGGVWVDATSFCLKPLDDWLPLLMESGFFAFPDGYPGRMMANSFLAAAPDNYLVVKWSALMNRYWRKRGKLLHYFWCMHLFEFIVRTDRKAADIWNRTPKLNSKGSILLKRMVVDPELFSPIPDDVDVSTVPWLKLSSSTKTQDIGLLDRPRLGMDIDLRALSREIAAQNAASAEERS